MIQHLLGWATLLVGLVVVYALSLGESRAAAPLLTAYIARVLLVVTHVYVARLPGTNADPATFLLQAVLWSRDGIQGALANFHTGAPIYSSLLAIVFAASAPSEFMALALNALFGALVVWNVWRLALLLSDSEAAARFAAWTAAIFPSLVLFSAMTLREVAVVYPCTLGLLYLARWWKHGGTWRMYLAVALLVVSSAFHSGMIVLVVACGLLLAVRWLRALVQLQGAEWARTSRAVLGIMVAAAMVVGTGVGLEKFGRLNRVNADVISSEGQIAARSRAAYLQNDIPTSVSGVIAQLPVRSAYFLFAPFPWMVRTPGDVIAMIDGLMYLVMFVALLRNYRMFARDGASLALAVLLGFAIIPFAVSTSNYGTALRHRAKLAPLVIVLYATARARQEREQESTGRAFILSPAH